MTDSAASVALGGGKSVTHTVEKHVHFLRKANEVAMKAMETGKHPFGCILVAPDGETIIDEHGNVDVVNHAESSLCRVAHAKYSAEYLWQCTLYSTFEPCAMCAATQYWANIGGLVYGATEETLLQLTGVGNAENPTLSLPCREVYSRGSKAITVIGPIAESTELVVAPHRSFWSRGD